MDKKAAEEKPKAKAESKVVAKGPLQRLADQIEALEAWHPHLSPRQLVDAIREVTDEKD